MELIATILIGMLIIVFALHLFAPRTDVPDVEKYVSVFMKSGDVIAGKLIDEDYARYSAGLIYDQYKIYSVTIETINNKVYIKMDNINYIQYHD